MVVTVWWWHESVESCRSIDCTKRLLWHIVLWDSNAVVGNKTFNKMYCYSQCNRFYTVFDQQIAQSLINDHLSPVVILHVATSLRWSPWLHIQRHTSTANSVKDVSLWSYNTILWIKIIAQYSVIPPAINTLQTAQDIPFNESDNSWHRCLSVIGDEILLEFVRNYQLI